MENNLINYKEIDIADKYVWIDKVILVAEDIELNYLYLRELIEPTGAMIIRAENGKEAVQCCLSNVNIDMVLMDLLMPMMNGYDATREIKKNRKDLPIIAQTAYAMSEDRRHAIEAGCDDFITKPIGREELLRKMDSFFSSGGK